MISISTPKETQQTWPNIIKGHKIFHYTEHYHIYGWEGIILTIYLKLIGMFNVIPRKILIVFFRGWQNSQEYFVKQNRTKTKTNEISWSEMKICYKSTLSKLNRNSLRFHGRGLGV